ALTALGGFRRVHVERLATMRKRRYPIVVLAVLGAALVLASTTGAGAGGLPTFTAPSRADTNVEGHSEPATIVDRNCVRYVADQGGAQLSTTTDGGRTWKKYEDVLSQKITPCVVGADDI